MTILHGYQAGDTSRFSMQLAFHVDPDGGHSATEEESLSWGGFQIWVDGHNLCAHHEEGELVDSVHWYLLGLLEWLVDHWDPILHEERLPARNAGECAWESMVRTRFPPRAVEAEADDCTAWERAWSEWWGRHALQAGREGGLFPDLYIRRYRQQVELSWGQTPLPGAPVGYRFLVPSGVARFDPRVVAEPLYDVLQNAVSYLCDARPESPRLTGLRDRLEHRTVCTS
jgi:hypothetical protein